MNTDAPILEPKRAIAVELMLNRSTYKTGPDAIEAMTASLGQSVPDKGNFDPLLAAHWAILNQTMKYHPYVLFELKADGGDYCPLCEVEVHEHPRAPRCTHPGIAKEWIRGCTDMILEHAREEGLVPKVQ